MAFITDSTVIWGAEKSVLGLISAGIELGHEIRLVVPRDAELAEPAARLGAEVILHDFERSPGLASGRLKSAGLVGWVRQLVASWRGARSLLPLLRDGHVAVSFSTWRTLEIAIAARLARVPSLFDLHDTFDGRLPRILLSALTWCANGCVVPSAACRRRGLLPMARRARVVPRPVEIVPVARSERSAPGTPLVVGIFGQIVPNKGLHLLLSAFDSQVSQRWRVRIVGGKGAAVRSSYEDGVRARAKSSSGGIEVHDAVRDPLVLMATCDVVINCSAHEAFGRTTVEALSVGAYPVAMQGTGPAEIVANVGIGAVCARRPADIARTIDLLAGDASRLAEARSKGPLLAAQRFTPGHVGREYFRIVESL